MKFLNSIADPASKESFVEINHLHKVYFGKAKCHPDDSWSDFTGCRYAEMRAEIKALKDEYKKLKASCEECRKFVSSVMQYKNFDKTSSSAKAMFRQLNRRIKAVNKLADKITRAEFALKIAINKQTRVENRIKQNSLNNNEEI